MIMALTLPLDLAMASPATNRVVDEPHLIDTAESRFFVPQGGPFFALGIELKIGATLLMPGVHYQILHMYEEATLASGKEVDAIVYIKDTPLTPLGSTVLLTCHYVGGEYSATTDALQQILDNLTLPDAETLGWGSVLNKPVQYPPTAHMHHIRNLFGTDEMVTVLEGVRQAILQGDSGTINALYQYIDAKVQSLNAQVSSTHATLQAIQDAIATHQSASNAHPKSTVGLGNVDNFATASITDAQGTTTAIDKFLTIRRLWEWFTARIATVTDIFTGTNGNKVVTVANLRAIFQREYSHSTDDISQIDPNTTLTQVIVTSHANAGTGGNRTIITQTFATTTEPHHSTLRGQYRISPGVVGNGGSFAERYFNGVNWTPWSPVLKSTDLPSGGSEASLSIAQAGADRNVLNVMTPYMVFEAIKHHRAGFESINWDWDRGGVVFPGWLTSGNPVGAGRFKLCWGSFSLAAGGGASQARTLAFQITTMFVVGIVPLYAATEHIGYSIIDSNNIRIHKGSNDTSARTGRYFVFGWGP